MTQIGGVIAMDTLLFHGLPHDVIGHLPYPCARHAKLGEESLVPLGWTVTAGIECMLGSATYFMSTGMSLQKRYRIMVVETKNSH